MIRVLVVDDSSMVRKVLTDLLESDPDIMVIGEAVNGREAVIKVPILKPDLITMDIVMPVMDGLTAVEQIMAENPTPIIVFTATLKKDEINVAFQSIQAGALEVLEKPKNIINNFTEIRNELVKKIKFFANIKIHKRLPSTLKNVDTSKLIRIASNKLIAIGASVGGPPALVTILKQLPANFPAGILIVQHIARGFSKGLVDWLNRSTELEVYEAKLGQNVRAGTVLVAPSDNHLLLQNDKIILEQSPPIHNCRPAVDVLFESVAKYYGERAIGVLLTGMGSDGAQGLKAIQRSGGFTIAQNEETCVVYGMPKSAIALDAVNKELALNDIPQAIIDAL